MSKGFCNAIEGYFVWGEQRCDQPAVRKVKDERGNKQPVCAEHLRLFKAYNMGGDDTRLLDGPTDDPSEHHGRRTALPPAGLFSRLRTWATWVYLFSPAPLLLLLVVIALTD